MYANNSLRVYLLNEASQCSYVPQMKDYIVNQVLEVMNYPGKAKQVKAFKQNVGPNVILVTILPMNIPFNQKFYEVSIRIFFMKNMPTEPPQIFIELPKGSGINPQNAEINKQTNRIMTQSLIRWTDTININTVLDEIKNSFIKQFPLYKQNPSQQQAQQLQQQPQQFQQQQIIMNNSNNINNMAQSATYFRRTGTSLYGQSMHLNNNQMSNSSGQQNNYQKPMGNIYNNVTNPVNQVSTNSNDPEIQLKNALSDEIKTKIESKLIKDKKSISQQNIKLTNYLNQFKLENQKIDNFLGQSSQIENMCQMDILNLNNEIQNINDYIMKRTGQNLSQENLFDFIQVNDPNDKLLITLIAQEASLEDLILLVKRGFEKNTIPFIDAIKYTRSLARELFFIKSKRKDILSTK